MDRYVKVTKSDTSVQGRKRPKQTHLAPFAPRNEGTSHGRSRLEVRQALMSSLKDENNPITHSDAPERGYHLVSNTSGHQMSNNVRAYEHDKSWTFRRNAKLQGQAALAHTAIFAGIVVYINGCTGTDVANLQLINMIQSNGGKVRYAFSKSMCTHIIADSNLSGKKEHDELQLRRSTTKVVRPTWVMASIAAGRRLPESQFAVIVMDAQPTINRVFAESAVSKKETNAARSRADDLAWLEARAATPTPEPELIAPPPSAQEPRSGQRKKGSAA